MKFKVGDIVIYQNPIYLDHYANGSKYRITKIYPLNESDKNTMWVKTYGATCNCSIELISRNSQGEAVGKGGYLSAVLRPTNTLRIKERLKIK